MYQRLVAYKEEHGNTKVPYSYQRDRQLAYWATRLRVAHNYNMVLDEWKRLLTSIVCVWVVKSSTYDEMYHRLVAYKMDHNDIIVP